jgi:hypothetical protein
VELPQAVISRAVTARMAIAARVVQAWVRECDGVDMSNQRAFRTARRTARAVNSSVK